MRTGDGIYLRKKTFWLDFRHKGQRHIKRLGKGVSLSVAKELAAVERASVLKGEAGIGGKKKKKDISFDKAAEEFLAWSKANLRPNSWRDYRLCVRQLEKSFAGMTLSAIHPFAIERHKMARKEAATVRANHEIVCLKRIFSWTKAQGLYDGENHPATVKLFEESKGRLRYLEPDEERALLDATTEPLRSLIVVGVNVGLRVRSEGLTLQWADVDLRTKQVSILGAYAKNKKRRVVPLNQPALNALAVLKSTATSDFVFARRDGRPLTTISKAFKIATRKADLLDVTPHTLRHTFGSRLGMAGVDPRTIQELGGWSSLSMVERYCHVGAAHKALAIKKLESFHDAIHDTAVSGVAPRLAQV
jgi:integrase